jgi:hypothetical protein
MGDLFNKDIIRDMAKEKCRQCDGFSSGSTRLTLLFFLAQALLAHARDKLFTFEHDFLVSPQ